MLGVCCATKYTHSSLLAGSHCAVSLFRGIVPRIKIHHSGRAMCGTSKLFDSLEQAFKLCCIMLKELKEKRGAAHTTMCLQRKEDTRKNVKTFLGGGCQLFVDFRVSRGSWNLTPAKSEGLVYCTISKFCGPRSMYEDQTLCNT
jgi:hypothetical protein